MPKLNQPIPGRVSKQDQQGAQKTILPNNSVEERHLSDALLLKILPTAASISFAGSVAPDGWLIEDGSVLKQNDFAELFSEIGTDWNTGGEAGDEFRLPDSRGRSDVGVGLGSGLTERFLADVDGAEEHTLLANESGNRSHFHPMNHGHFAPGGYAAGAGVDSFIIGGGGSYPQTGGPFATNGPVINNFVGNTSSASTDAQFAHPTISPFNAKNKIIKY